MTTIDSSRVGNVLVFTGDRNAPDKPADYTGAFLPEALAFMRLYGVPASQHIRVDLSKGENVRRQQVYDFIRRKGAELGQINTYAFFCHGLTRKIQLGVRIPDLDNFANLIKSFVPDGTTKVTIALYCCSTGDGPGVGGDGGFADQLRDALCRVGLVDSVVMAHAVSGHTTKNTQKKLFEGMGSPVGGIGGTWIVAPGSPLMKKWRTGITTSSSTLRFRVPFMTIAEIHRELV
jgi:hypothetical protein